MQMKNKVDLHVYWLDIRQQSIYENWIRQRSCIYHLKTVTVGNKKKI